MKIIKLMSVNNPSVCENNKTNDDSDFDLADWC